MPTYLTDTQWATWSLRGRSLADVAATIAGMPEAATTEWFPRYSYETDGRVLTGVEAHVGTRVTMPRWAEYARASESEQREWDRFCAALRAHEEGHLRLVNEYLWDIDERLLGNTAEDAEAVWRRALNDLEAASQAYDSETDHGRLHGTEIDISIIDF